MQSPYQDSFQTAGAESITITHHGRTIDADLYRPAADRFPVVIFSHGYNGYRDDFKKSAEFLTENGIGAITFIFCGSGARDQSGFPTTSMTLFTERDDLLAVMDYAQSLPQFDGNLFLFGGSQGGMVSAMAAKERRKDIKGLILLYPALCIPDDWKTKYPEDNGVPEEIPWWGVTLGRNFVLSLRNFDIFTDMPAFTKPVLLLHGTKDLVVSLRYSERAAKAYPNAKLVPFVGEGHGFSPAATEKVHKHLLAFLRDCI